MVWPFSSKKKGPVQYALVLAGGASKRMGEDKNWIDFDGQPMLRQVLRRQHESGIEKAIICFIEDENPKRYLKSEGKEKWKETRYQWLEDGLPWTSQMWQSIQGVKMDSESRENLTIRHPLYGVHDILRSAARDKKCTIAMLSSNDVPILDPKLVGVLHEHLDKTCTGVMASMADGTPAPLLSLVRPIPLLKRLEPGYQATMQALAKGEKTRSVTEVLIEAGVKVVDAETLTLAGVDLTRLEGANSPEQLTALKRRWMGVNI